MTTASPDIRFRIATAADVPAIAACRLNDPTVGPADWRMASYFDGKHHPQQARRPRTGYVALAGDTIVGYIAGHLTTRFGCRGEVQYLFVAPVFRRRGIATALLGLMAEWFAAADARKVCVNVDADSPGATPFYESTGAVRRKPFWHQWDDITTSIRIDKGSLLG